MNKKCVKCKETKPISEFYSDPRAKDKLCYYCKKCSYDKCLAYRKKNRDKFLNKLKEYHDAHQEEARQYRIANKAKESAYGKLYRLKHKKEKSIYNKRYMKDNKLKINAHHLANMYFLKYKSKRKKYCEFCGDISNIKHHPDYNKPLDVQWLCHSCHNRLHADLRKDNV